MFVACCALVYINGGQLTDNLMPEIQESQDKPRLLSLLKNVHAAEAELFRHYSLRSDGGAYAALLVATALGAEVLKNGVNPGFDLLHPELKRLEVRSRRRPWDNRNERRIAVPKIKQGKFDHLVHVTFERDFSVTGAYIVPHDSVYEHLSVAGVKYLQYDAGVKLSGARDITVDVQIAQAKL